MPRRIASCFSIVALLSLSTGWSYADHLAHAGCAHHEDGDTEAPSQHSSTDCALCHQLSTAFKGLTVAAVTVAFDSQPMIEGIAPSVIIPFQFCYLTSCGPRAPPFS